MAEIFELYPDYEKMDFKTFAERVGAPEWYIKLITPELEEELTQDEGAREEFQEILKEIIELRIRTEDFVEKLHANIRD